MNLKTNSFKLFKMMNNKSILITGGTGSLGKAITKHLLEKYPKVRKVIIFSRDEQKQFEMNQEFPIEKFSQMRYFIGDVRDLNRLERAFIDVDYVIHCAAMKHVPIAEYNPDECIKTNIFGAQNIINAALKSKVKKVIALSTDKASSPVNLYGATKLTSDKLFIAANNIKGNDPIGFSVVRYGNVMGSKGSVIPFFLQKKKEGIIPITDPNMTRFNISLQEGVNLVLFAIENSLGGEMYVPKIPSYNIMDLADAIAPECKKEIIGIRQGEKIHEEMISESDSFNTYDIGKYYIIIPNNIIELKEHIIRKYNAKLIKSGFNYNSKDNPDRETIESLREKLNL